MPEEEPPPGERPIEPAPGSVPVVEHSLAPRKPRTVGGAVYLLVLAVTAAGIGLVVLDRWRGGLTLMGAACVGAAVARLVIPQHQSGMLGLRRKAVDVASLLLMGLGLIVLAAVIPVRAV